MQMRQKWLLTPFHSPPTGSQPAKTPADTQPEHASAPTTIPAKQGVVAALDGTHDDKGSGTDNRKYSLKYPKDFRLYTPGVGNPTDDPNWFVEKKLVAFGEKEAQDYLVEAKTSVNIFIRRSRRIRTSLLTSLDIVAVPWKQSSSLMSF